MYGKKSIIKSLSRTEIFWQKRSWIVYLRAHTLKSRWNRLRPLNRIINFHSKPNSLQYVIVQDASEMKIVDYESDTFKQVCNI
jgi:hypothetical protein